MYYATLYRVRGLWVSRIFRMFLGNFVPDGVWDMRFSSMRKMGLTALVVYGVVCAPSFAFARYDKNYIGEMAEHKAIYEDTLIHLSRKYELGFIQLRAANPDLDPWIPGKDVKIVLPTQHLLPDAPRKSVVINLPEMRVYIYMNKDEAPVTFPIGIGREGLATPIGKTTVVRKTKDPIWRPTDRMRKEKPELPAVVYPGPDNPMGTHALYLGWSTYAIHGTNKPYGIGRPVSSGCIRMYPEHITQFFDMVPVGTTINVVNQPIKVEWIDNEMYLEAHPDIEQGLMMEQTGKFEHQKLSDNDMRLIIRKAGPYKELLDWAKIRTAVRERKGYPIKIATVLAKDKKKVEGVHQANDTVDESAKKGKKQAKKEADKKTRQAKNGDPRNGQYVISKDERLYTISTSTSKIPEPQEKPKR